MTTRDKKRILVIPGPFMPHNETITQLSYRMLCNIDCEIDVVAFKAKNDEYFNDYVKNDEKFKKFNIEYVGFDWKQLDISSKNMNLFKLRKILKAYERKCIGMANNREYDFVFSFSGPNYTHPIAGKIKAKNREIKWFASFSDPISRNLYANQLFKEKARTKALALILKGFVFRRSFETVALKNADKLVFISDELRDYITRGNEEYKKKSIIYPITYVKEWPGYKAIKSSVSKKTKNKKIIFAHFGNIYGLRKIGAFLDALSELKKESPELTDQIEVHQYGDIDKYQKAVLDASEVKELFIMHDRLDYDDCIKKMNEADVLLIFDTIVPNGQIQPFLPSKITDCLLANKPIFAVTPSVSPLHRFLDDKHTCARYDAKEIALCLKKLVGNHEPVINDVDWLDNDIASLEIFGKDFDMIDSIKRRKK